MRKVMETRATAVANNLKETVTKAKSQHRKRIKVEEDDIIICQTTITYNNVLSRL